MLTRRHVFFLQTLALSIAPLILSAQSPSSLKNSQDVRFHVEAADQEQFLPYWTTEGTWDSELQLRNNQSSQPLTVTPVLRTADGSETVLSPVTINPEDVKSFDINTVLRTMAPQLLGTYGSVVLRYQAATAGTLYPVLMVHDGGHPIAWHIDGREEQSYEAAGREGVWWLPKNSTSAYLILTNYGANPIPLELSLYDANGKETKQMVSLQPRQMIRYSVRQLIQAAGLGGSYGGIKVFAPVHAGSLDTLHVLFDEKIGFSALLKMFEHDPNAKMEEHDFAGTAVWTLRAPMLALSQPDPALGFPAGTRLQPQLFVRNTTAKSLNVGLRFNWRGDVTTGKASGPSVQLAPYETRRFDIASLQDGKVLPADARWSSVTLTSNGSPDEIMAVAASYDANLRFGAQTPFSDVLNFKWEGNEWEYDAQHDSIITAGNGGSKPIRAAFTMFYNQGTEKYELEQALQPDEQMWIDVGKLVRERAPDKNGKTLPLDINSGSYEFRDLTDHGVGNLFEGKVVLDRTYGQVTYGCAVCCGYKTTLLSWDPFGVPLNFSSQNGVQSLSWCDSGYVDVSDNFYGNWSTANTGIATVDYYAKHTGWVVGSTTSYSSGRLSWPSTACPILVRNPQGTDNVATLNCTPSSVTRGANVTCSVSNGSTFSNWNFTDSQGVVVTGGGTGNSWAGMMVTNGTVRVTVNGSTTLAASVTVNNRSGFAIGAATATEQSNNFSCSTQGPTLSIPSPPTATFTEDGSTTGDLGEYCDELGYVVSTSTVTDGGPNNGYRYVTSVTAGNSTVPWAYDYVISPDLKNSSSAFSLAQCGNYNAQSNPNGYISQPNLLANTIRHESGTVQSHYAQYLTAVNNSSYNPGAIGEQQVGSPSTPVNTFVGNVNTAMNNGASNIISNTKSPEPCGPNYNASCTFQGYTNFSPYALCQ